MLVVEENELMRRLIAEALAHEAHVITAANGVNGLKLTGTPGLDVIVTGLLLPGLSGGEMISAIRQRPDLDNLPILIVTALADETMRVRMLREGAQDYIVKPFAPQSCAPASGYWRQLGKSVALTELVSAISAAASHRPGPEHER